MATTVTNTVSYAGKYAGEFIRAAFKANDTVQNVTLKENIEWRAVVKKLVDDISFGAPSCAWNPTGTVAVTERWLTLKKFSIHQELCLNTFLNDWAAGDVQNGNLEPAMVDALLANMLEGVAQANENMIWTGNGTANPTTEYDGFLTGFDADATVIKPSAVAITKANVFATLESIIAQVPTAVKYANEKPIIYIDPASWEAFMNASMAAGNGWYAYGGQPVPQKYMGLFDIAVCPGMPSSTVVAARKSNLWFGTNVLADWNNVQIADMTQFGEDNFRFSMKFFAGAQHGIGSEIVAYSTWF